MKATLTNVEKIEAKVARAETKIAKTITSLNQYIDGAQFLEIAKEVNPRNRTREVLDKMNISEETINWNEIYWIACDVDHALESIEDANRAMPEAIAKDERKTNKENKKAEDAKIIASVDNPVINKFLETWKASFIEWANKQKQYMYDSDERIEEIANREVELKKLDLIARIAEKAGAIVDVSFLTIGNDGSLNGKVIGEKKAVWVETIFAGGYNIQRLHYRVLVK